MTHWLAGEPDGRNCIITSLGAVIIGAHAVSTSDGWGIDSRRGVVPNRPALLADQALAHAGLAQEVDHERTSRWVGRIVEQDVQWRADFGASANSELVVLGDDNTTTF